MALLFVCKLLATTLSLGSGSSGGIFSPSLFMGATIGGAFGRSSRRCTYPALRRPTFAMVGMGAMVGGGTGAAMTAVAMIFEMTRDYEIVLPMIVAVALSVGVRRLLSPENIYTFKLFRRGRAVPKALQANMFLVQRASEVMDRDVVFAPAQSSVEEFLSRPGPRRIRHVVITEDDRIVGVVRVNTALRYVSASAQSSVTMREVASINFIVVEEDEILYEVIQSTWRQGALMAVVVRRGGTGGASDVVGIISKEHVADSVASSTSIYAD